MTPPLFYLADLGTGATVELTGTEAHHAGTVRRLRAGEAVSLADGRGGRAECVVESVHPESISFTVLRREQVAQRQPRLVVVQALAKTDRGETAVELMTELGVDEIMPWQAARSVPVWRGDKSVKAAEKWRRVAHEAGKQSRRGWLPVIADLLSTAQVSSRMSRAALSLVLTEQATEPLAGCALPADGEVLVVVGPEGGITDDELADFTAAGARPVRLGPEIMRTSTAGAAALAVLSVGTGRWNRPG